MKSLYYSRFTTAITYTYIREGGRTVGSGRVASIVE